MATKRFHICFRADELVYVGPSGRDDFPTAYTLRSGMTGHSTGEWQDNVKLVEKLLAASDDGVERIRREVAALRAEEAVLRETIAAGNRELEQDRRAIEMLKRVLPLALTTEQMTDARAVVGVWLRSGRNYLRVEERKSLVKALGLEDVAP